MDNSEYLPWTTSDVDFYDLFCITFDTFSDSVLRRAYHKAELIYHPDKAGDKYDPVKYEMIRAANKVLGDAVLKQKYDNHRNAKLQRVRANALFEGRRRQMKEDLEARESGGGGLKRAREDERQNEINQELSKAAEEGRKRRAARASMMAENVSSSPAPTPKKAPEPPMPTAESQPSPVIPNQEEDEVERLERLIKEKEAAKAKRRSEKKAWRSFMPIDSPTVAGTESVAGTDTATPIKRPNIMKEVKADNMPSAPPTFSFSPNIPTPKRNDFAATMERLKAAGERRRMEEQIREQEAEAS